MLGAALVGMTIGAQATFYNSPTWNSGWDNGNVVPDNNYSGWTDTRTITDAPVGTVGSLAVNLTLTGGWNGDLYAYLVNNNGGFCVLLDQIGTDPYGNSYAGMTVTLTADPMFFGSNQGPIAGVNTLPSGVYEPDVTSGAWSSLLNGPANNSTWTLFIADLSGGGVTTLQSWGLQMDIVAVPEVETWIAAALAGAFGAFWVNRQIMFGVKKS